MIAHPRRLVALDELLQLLQVTRRWRIRGTDAERHSVQHQRPIAPDALEHRARPPSATEKVLADDLDPIDIEAPLQRPRVMRETQPHPVPEKAAHHGNLPPLPCAKAHTDKLADTPLNPRGVPLRARKTRFPWKPRSENQHPPSSHGNLVPKTNPPSVPMETSFREPAPPQFPWKPRSENQHPLGAVPEFRPVPVPVPEIGAGKIPSWCWSDPGPSRLRARARVRVRVGYGRGLGFRDTPPQADRAPRWLGGPYE